ncbi:Retrotransposon gag protein [Arachis hypogaea]|nr:Retrotransposon gag protein [Arachis hypogaea]
MEKMMKNQELTSKNLDASMKNMERQIGQLSKQIAIERPSSSLPSDTIPNPKEECKAIQIRSGKTLVDNKEATKKPIESNKEPTEKEEANNKDVTASNHTPKKLKEKDNQPHNSRGEKEELAQGQKHVGKTFTPPLSYPQRFNKEAKDQHFHKLLHVFKKLEINIPLAEALEQMPLYAKFLKLINKKRSWNEKETILLIEECSALIQKGLPPKLEDPGRASINLMPSFLVKKLCIEEVNLIQMSLELVDKLVICPRGVIENLLVKVDKFIFPADFVVLNLDEDGGDSIILGRPFLATARAIIDVEQGKLTLRMHDEIITLNVFPETQHIDEKRKCMETNKGDLQWKKNTNKTIIGYLPKQETNNTAGQKENETVRSDEGK